MHEHSNWLGGEDVARALEETRTMQEAYTAAFGAKMPVGNNRKARRARIAAAKRWEKKHGADDPS